MSPALGTHVVVDFDGTLTHLAVPWAALRDALCVARIEDLWKDSDMGRWEAVTRAEVDAAGVAVPSEPVTTALAGVPSLAILTNNDETAVERFLARYPELRARVRLVVGRRSLAGPKTDFDVFSRGYRRCVAAVAPAGRPASITYVGDMAYELDFAQRLGATAVAVTALQMTARDEAS